MNLTELFQSQLSGGVLEQLSEKTGINNTEKTSSAANAVFSTMLGAISKNASTPEGAESLAGALDRDHDGSILNDVMGYITGSSQPDNTSTTNGAGILSHVLGDKQEEVMNAVSNATNLDSGKLSSMMTTLAPIIMGVLGKAKQESGADAGGFSNILGSVFGAHADGNPLMNI
ncbi:MAG TPA: DUF937 domain-containing protein, partial [Saprospiraceae bacterium]|nr:DUF937 domain-containing protein [Saprospiraceae bacterium]